MARKYRVEGTKDFLYWAIALFALGLWAVKDGWFPSESVREKHPLRVAAVFETGGVISEVTAQVEDTVRQGEVLARLQRSEYETRHAAIERAIRSLDEAEPRTGAGSTAESPAGTEGGGETRTRLNAELAEVRRAMDARELKAPTNGVVVAVLTERNADVRANEPVVEIDPRNHFYAFNKSLAALSLLGAVVCAIIHLKVR
jgi:multidrug resistance efflux pump